MLIKAGIAAKEVVVPGGDNSWSSIHVRHPPTTSVCKLNSD